MKYPQIKIVWRELGKMDACIYIKKLSNGFLVGNTYFATENSMLKHLAEAVKTPDAYFEPPTYHDKLPN